IPSLPITLDGISQVPSKCKHNPVDQNSVMWPSATSSTPWSLCALHCCKEHKRGTIQEFTDYWDELVHDKHPHFEASARSSLLATQLMEFTSILNSC
ncbi:hypothetical protein SCLCIDRAFT_1219128, partial [Scleroderma citrinum Foug A]